MKKPLVESQMTADALAMLERHGFSRRKFLKGSGALVVAFGAAELAGRFGIAPGVADAQGGATPQTLDSWIAIGADGRVTAYTGRADMGQADPIEVADRVGDVRPGAAQGEPGHLRHGPGPFLRQDGLADRLVGAEVDELDAVPCRPARRFPRRRDGASVDLQPIR